jgi:hypothetical protein
MTDPSQIETYDRTEPPGTQLWRKQPKRLELRGKLEKLIEGPTGELTRIFRMRSQYPQF